ncbi:ribosomal protein L1/ribosomal biogenesis protein [Dipodascopsis uninucleata]
MTTENLSKLSKEQTKKAVSSLLKHIEKTKAETEADKSKKLNLLADNVDSPKETILLVVGTKKYLSDKLVMKPKRILVPHPLYDPEQTSICLITKDPQRLYKDVLLADDSPVKDIITRIVGVSKLKGKFKQFQARRQLRDEYDIFFADDRVAPLFPELLGKSFISVKKLPIPINLQSPKALAEQKAQRAGSKKRKLSEISTEELESKEKTAISTKRVKAEIDRTLKSVSVIVPAGSNTTIKVGYSTFSADDVTENIEAVVEGLIKSKVIKDGWEGIRSIHVKTAQSVSLPIYLADKLV